jgi:hypothetical protein
MQLSNPHDRVIATPKPVFTVLKVVEKATGNIKAIKDYRFNPAIHEHIEEGEVTVSKKELKEPSQQDDPNIGYDGDELKPWIYKPDGRRFKTVAALKRFITLNEKQTSL